MSLHVPRRLTLLLRIGLPLVAVSVVIVGAALWKDTPAVAVGNERLSTVIWMVPDPALSDGDLLYGDAAVYARISDAAGNSIVSPLGNGMRARIVPGGSLPMVAVQTIDGDWRFLRYEAETSKWLTACSPAPGSAVKDAIQADGRILFQQQEQRRTIAAVDAVTGQKADYLLPILTPDAKAGHPGDGVKMWITDEPSPGWVGAFVSAGDRVLAFSWTGQAAAVTDLMEGRTVLLEGYSFVGDAALGGDGYVYAVVARVWEPDFGLWVLRIDPATLSVLSSYATGFSGTFNKVVAVPTPTGAAVFVSVEPVGDELVADQHMWLVDSSAIRALQPLPRGTALWMGPAEGNAVLLYGGAAKNVVYRYDLTSQVLSEASELSAPPGAVVLAASD
jgi:hypothetical protein